VSDTVRMQGEITPSRLSEPLSYVCYVSTLTVIELTHEYNATGAALMTDLLLVNVLHGATDCVRWFRIMDVVTHFVCIVCGHCPLQPTVCQSILFCKICKRISRYISWLERMSPDMGFENVCIRPFDT
jgi:hypothetical protein